MSELWFIFFCGGLGISFVGLMLWRRRAPWIKHTHKMDIVRQAQRALYNWSTTRDERAARSARCMSTIGGRRLDSANNRPGLRVHPPAGA